MMTLVEAQNSIMTREEAVTAKTNGEIDDAVFNALIAEFDNAQEPVTETASTSTGISIADLKARIGVNAEKVAKLNIERPPMYLSQQDLFANASKPVRVISVRHYTANGQPLFDADDASLTTEEIEAKIKRNLSVEQGGYAYIVCSNGVNANISAQSMPENEYGMADVPRVGSFVKYALVKQDYSINAGKNAPLGMSESSPVHVYEYPEGSGNKYAIVLSKEPMTRLLKMASSAEALS